MKTLRLELMIYAVGSWVVRYTLALREFLMLGKPMFAAGRLPFFCLLSLEIIDTCFPPRACPGHYKYLSILCRVSFIAFSVFYVKGKNGTSFFVFLSLNSFIKAMPLRQDTWKHHQRFTNNVLQWNQYSLSMDYGYSTHQILKTELYNTTSNCKGMVSEVLDNQKNSRISSASMKLIMMHMKRSMSPME